MNVKRHTPKDENGFVLVLALLMLVLLGLLGIYATTTSVFELRVAGNDKVVKQTFYKADGGLQVGIEMVEQNLGCDNGFSPSGFSGGKRAIDGIDIYDTKFAYAEEIEDIHGASSTTVEDDIPSDTIRALSIPDDPANRVDSLPHTNIAVYGTTKPLYGFDQQANAGYGGSNVLGHYIDMHIHSQQIETNNSTARIILKWKHIIGQEGACRY
ncbi:MAG: PilX N-terminal domain-containing pilus assembly protein [Desulfopila sp.]